MELDYVELAYVIGIVVVFCGFIINPILLYLFSELHNQEIWNFLYFLGIGYFFFRVFRDALSDQ